MKQVRGGADAVCGEETGERRSKKKKKKNPDRGKMGGYVTSEAGPECVK